MFRRSCEAIFGGYAHVVIEYPLWVISSSVVLCSILTAYSGYYHHGTIDFDPKKGFETRGTHLSAARLTLNAIHREQVKAERILRWFYESDINRKGRDVKEKYSTSPSITNSTSEPISVDYDDYGVSPEPNASDLEDPCESFAALGDKIPFEVVEYLAKIMIKVRSYEELFSVPTMKHLCRLDQVVEETIFVTNFTNPAANLKHSFNIPLYTTCPNLKTANTCDAINEKDVSDFRRLLELCRRNSTEAICSASSINQVIHFLLPKSQSKQNIISVVLKVTMYNGKDREFYDQLEKNLAKYLGDSESTQLVGVSFYLKDKIFVESLRNDTILAGISAFLVFFCFLVYSRSVLFTFFILLIVAFSTTVAFFIYSVILGIDFFPFINLLVVVLLVSIGADDAFLLLVYFRREVKKLSNLEYKIGTIYIPLYRKTDLIARSLRLSLHHALSSMFVTSLTTAIAFLTNLASPVLVLRCFGIFACITIITNYVLVLLILPAAIILIKPVRTQHSRFRVTKIGDEISKWEISHRCALFVHGLKYVITFLAIVISIACAIVVIYKPGMQLPRYNPTKLLVDSNRHEFFDNNLHFFDFEWKRSPRLVQNFALGIPLIKSSNSLSITSNPSSLSLTSNFELTREKLNTYKNIFREIASKYEKNATSWAEAAWNSKDECFKRKIITSACVMKFAASTDHLPYEFPDDSAVLPSDGPLINNDFEIFGYFFSIPTQERLRVDADAIERVFGEIDGTCLKLKSLTDDVPLCLSSSEITRFYDIISQLKSSSLSSVLISIGICLLVVVLCTRVLTLSIFALIIIFFIILWTIAVLALLGRTIGEGTEVTIKTTIEPLSCVLVAPKVVSSWQLSVVESTILVITIGLSFDYTLHYAVGMREAKLAPMVEKIGEVHSTAGVACSLGAVTLFLAGAPLLFSQTAAFSQVGTMLVVLSFTSIFGAAVVFPAFIAVFNCKRVLVTRM
ncbi:unnamed protein product [Caenorhabditis auriculariae]|uniref:SSD domain-containing protein n=1 Tax=Caenorhabditis auriculariae TaxID=2777116 RepID=A0A8S1H9H2_9PELO|nr:unnamed protein product [Caenorhabditis auriculariae]